MAMQTGDSCAAHCTVIAIAELFNTRHNMTPQYAENTVWPAIQFKIGENQGGTDELAKKNNSDPRKIVSFANDTGGGAAVTATLRCDDVAKASALRFVDAMEGMKLGGLFNMMKGQNATVTTDIAEGVYYNASFLMFGGAAPTPGNYTKGMHNILVTRSGGDIWYYNSNEAVPSWIRTAGNDAWKILRNQNAGGGSYVFTGVLVEMKAQA